MNLTYLEQATASGDALNMANVIFNRFRRTLTPRVLLLFTDGFTNTGADVFTAAENLKRSSISVFSIGIGNGINRNELERIADRPSSKYVKLVSDYSELVNTINNITIQTCLTPAFIVRNQKITLTTDQNEIKLLQLDLDGAIGSVQFETNHIRGLTELEISWLRNNQIEEETFEKFEAKKFSVEIPHNSERIYLKLKGLYALNIFEFTIFVN